MRLYAGIDIGGTNAKVGLVDGRGQVVRRATVPTGRQLAAPDLVSRLAAAVGALIRHEKVVGLGAAAPGFVMPDGEAMVNFTNLPQLHHYPLRARLEQATGLPTRLENDANAAAIGEYRFGAGQGAERLLVVTVGTGIGVGMVAAGEVVRASWQGLGLPGHVLVARDGPACVCGGRGCVQALASVPAILAAANREGCAYADLAAVTAHARRGEPGADGALRGAGAWLGTALATLTHVLRPNRVLVGGGGVDAAEELLLEPVRAALFAHCMPFFAHGLTFARAGLGNDAGLVGAAALVT